MSQDGRPLPHDSEAEMMALGSMILSPEALEIARDRLCADDFYRIAHQVVFTAILDVFDDKGQIELFFIREELDRQGKLEKVGGVEYLIELAESVGTSANIEYYIDTIKGHALRRYIVALGPVAREAFEPGSEPVEILERIRSYAEMSRLETTELPTLPAYVQEATDYLERRSRGELPFIETGIGPLDRILHGLQPGMLSIVGGRPGDGKTSLAENIICNASIGRGHPTVFFSAEMPGYQVIINLQRILTGIDYSEVRDGTFTAGHYQQWEKAAQSIKQAPLILDATGAISITAIVSRSASLVRRKGVELVIVDYIQLLRPGRAASRNLEVAGIVQDLKALAKRHNIHVMALSQLARPSKDQPGQRLKWSGEQEEAADVVVLLGRPKEYADVGKKEEPDVATRKVVVAKNRHGRAGIFYLDFDKPILTFRESDYGRERNGEAAAGQGGQERPPSRGQESGPDSGAPGQGDQRDDAGPPAAQRPATQSRLGDYRPDADDPGTGPEHIDPGEAEPADEEIADVPEDEIPF
ncbi:MAG TPA: DnaB-like helicase C-terminal domain-containing protein [Anaerolineae bacterium]|nr:DnaB-like helicase C-terminal domain-containing protein [Anaerolineae bacterium]